MSHVCASICIRMSFFMSSKDDKFHVCENSIVSSISEEGNVSIGFELIVKKK